MDNEAGIRANDGMVRWMDALPAERLRIRWAGVKPAQRALEKLLRSYSGDCRCLLDVCREVCE